MSRSRPSKRSFAKNLPDMDPLTLEQIAEFVGVVRQGGRGDELIHNLNTDSRTVRPGELFVALRGEKFDGHRFIEEAASRGAVGALAEADWNGRVPSSFSLLRVPDTLLAYQQIAAQYRESLRVKVVAITGSNGKTSTKDFTASVLSRRFRVTKTVGNFNNHVGLPRTILQASSEDEIGVWEIGMNHPGEIAPLAQIAKPDVAIITNIGIAHIEFMGSREAIAQEKGDLAASLGAEGALILHGADEFAHTIAQRTASRVIFAGVDEGEVQARDITQTANGAEFELHEGAHRCHAVLPVPGLHMVQNALLAVAAGRLFGVSLEECAAGLISAPLTKARLQIKTIHGVQFIDDSYNANPDSTKAALRTLAELETSGQRFAVLGQMLELGAESRRGHQEVGELAASLGIDSLIAIGNDSAEIAAGAESAGLTKSKLVSGPEEAVDLLCESARPGDLVLVKGSRSARTERVLEEFAKRPQEARCAP
jgi:UDP-N-acetylmuramoyl-tripeptide--D-alanyl-D-alanine ligase